MIGVIMRIMARTLVRDRGALALGVVMPLAVFVVFATIFAGATGEQLRIRVAIADEQRSEPSARLVAALRADPSLAVAPAAVTADEVMALVTRGTIDAGLVIRREGRPVIDLTGEGPAPVLVLYDPVRAVAARILGGQIQRAWFSALPDAALRSTADLLGEAFVTFTPDQRDSMEARFADLALEMAASEPAAAEPGPFDGLVATSATGASLGVSHVAYYAGAVAMLFLLFSASHGALALFDERDSGLLDRILAGPGGMGAVVGGKLLFLTAQGVVQAGLIFVLAWLGWGVPLPARLPGFLLVTVAASLAAAGLAMALVAACTTRRQAQAFSNVAILVISAVGGSMVPRFLMPPGLQTIGWLTPTAWAVEAYSGLFWRGQPLTELWLPVAVLLASGLVGALLARRLARRDERI